MTAMDNNNINARIDTAAEVARRALRLALNLSLAALAAAALYAAFGMGRKEHFFTAAVFIGAIVIVNRKKKR